MARTYIFLMASVLPVGCGVPIGPAYDSAQDNPANALPEKIVVAKSVDSADEGEAEFDRAQFEKWKKEKELNSGEYQEFLEYQQWLKYQKEKENQLDIEASKNE